MFFCQQWGGRYWLATYREENAAEYSTGQRDADCPPPPRLWWFCLVLSADIQHLHHGLQGCLPPPPSRAPPPTPGAVQSCTPSLHLWWFGLVVKSLASFTSDASSHPPPDIVRVPLSTPSPSRLWWFCLVMSADIQHWHIGISHTCPPPPTDTQPPTHPHYPSSPPPQ